MESSHKDILIRLRQNIIDDVDVYNGIIRPLASEYILKEEDVLHIGNGATKEDRAKILLDILPGYLYFETFIVIFTHAHLHTRKLTCAI